MQKTHFPTNETLRTLLSDTLYLHTRRGFPLPCDLSIQPVRNSQVNRAVSVSTTPSANNNNNNNNHYGLRNNSDVAARTTANVLTNGDALCVAVAPPLHPRRVQLQYLTLREKTRLTSVHSRVSAPAKERLQ